jgi:hypothetical protein
MLDQEEPRLAVTDQEAVARMRHHCDKRVHGLLEEFNNVRAESVAFVAELKDTELHRGGDSPKNWTHTNLKSCMNGSIMI